MSAEPSIVELTDPTELEAVLSSDAGAIIIAFDPCRGRADGDLSREIQPIALRFAGAPVRFCKVRTDLHPELGRPFGIRLVPTVLCFIDGRLVDSTVGRIDRMRLDKLTQTLLSRVVGDGFFSRLVAGLRRLAS